MEKLQKDPLALALTRPPMIMGVMIEVLFFNLTLCALSYVYLKTLYILPAFGVLHILAVIVSKKEPTFLMLFWKWLHQTPPLSQSPALKGINHYELG